MPIKPAKPKITSNNATNATIYALVAWLSANRALKDAQEIGQAATRVASYMTLGMVSGRSNGRDQSGRGTARSHAILKSLH
jgi:hypothetical protein